MQTLDRKGERTAQSTVAKCAQETKACGGDLVLTHVEQQHGKAQKHDLCEREGRKRSRCSTTNCQFSVTRRGMDTVARCNPALTHIQHQNCKAQQHHDDLCNREGGEQRGWGGGPHVESTQSYTGISDSGTTQSLIYERQCKQTEASCSSKVPSPASCSSFWPNQQLAASRNADLHAFHPRYVARRAMQGTHIPTPPAPQTHTQKQNQAWWRHGTQTC